MAKVFKDVILLFLSLKYMLNMDYEYCTSMCCFGHKNVYKSFEEQWYRSCETFYFKRDEANRVEWCYREEVKNICGNCKKDDCYTCQRWEVIKYKLRGVLDRRETRYQPAIIKLRFYRHPGQICPFITRTVGVVESDNLSVS